MAAVFSLTSIDRGIAAMLTSFLIYSVSNVIYYKYRRVFPLFIAGLLIQTIDLIAFWIYSA